MAKIYISDIQPNQEIASAFIVAEKQLRTARTGSAYLTVKLIDKTGGIAGRVWDRAAEIADTIVPKSVAFVRGRSEKYRDELQIQIIEISPVPSSDIDPSDFLPVCPLDTDALFEEFKRYALSLKDRFLLQLMRAILSDSELMGKFKRAPAAKAMHHAYLGGLLEHTVSVAGLASKISDHYPDTVDRDMLIAGALLHDIGKVDEFVYDLAIDYSHEGRLIGHMIMGVQILEDKFRTLKNSSPEDEMHLKHLILSHHGEAQFGAVKLPMTREAFALHYADDLDAKMNTITRILADSQEGDEAWTGYQSVFQRYFFRGLPSERASLPKPAEADSEEERGVQLSIWDRR